MNPHAASPFIRPGHAEPGPVVRHRVLAAERGCLLSVTEDDPWIGLLASALAVDRGQVCRFVNAAGECGRPADPAHLYLDPSHALRRLAMVHASDKPGLRELAVQLFEPFQGLLERRAVSVGA